MFIFENVHAPFPVGILMWLFYILPPPPPLGMFMSRLVLMLKHRDTPLWIKLEQLEMKPQYYAFRWLTLLLSQEFPLPGNYIISMVKSDVKL